MAGTCDHSRRFDVSLKGVDLQDVSANVTLDLSFVIVVGITQIEFVPTGNAVDFHDFSSFLTADAHRHCDDVGRVT
jgi:hypothetical protein